MPLDECTGGEEIPLRPCQYNYPFIGRLFFVFDFFKFSVDNIVIFRVVCRSISTGSLLLGMLLLGDFHQFLGNLCQFLHFRFDSGFVFTFQSSFQCSQRRLDSSFVVSRQFVACFFNLLTGAVQQMVALVASLYQLFKLTVSFGVSFCVAYHFLDFIFVQTRRSLDSDLLLFTAVFVFRGNVQDTVSIDIEGNFDLRHAARCRVDTIQVELTQRFVISRTFTFTLQHMDGYRRLVVFSGREHLAVLGRDSGVFRDQRGHHTAHGFDTQRQRGNVQQQYVFYVTSQNTTLNSSTDGYSFVRVNIFTRLFTKEFSNFLLNHWHTSLTTNEDNVVDIRYGQASVLQCNFQRLNGTVYQIFNQAFQFRTSHFDVHVFRTGRVCSDVRQVNVGLLSGRQFDFRFFCRFFQALHCQRIVAQVNALIFLEFFNQIVDQTTVEVFTTQVGITVGCQNFEGFFAVNFVDFDNGNIESTTTQVINRDSTVASTFVQTVSQRSCGRFVDDTFYFQTSDTACVFGCLTLSIVKVCRYGNNSFSYRFTQVIFSGFLHFFQHFSRDLRRCHFLAFNFDPCVAVISSNNFERHDGNITLYFFVLEAAANQAFNRKQGVLRVRHCLTFSRLTNQSFTILGIGNDRRRGAIAFGVLQYTRSGAIHNRYTRVGSTQVDTNYFTHLNVSTIYSVIMWL
ncbi:hypothetical protein HMPREF1617_02092 [Escherichia coli 908675]|uniref:Putative glutamate dehydrogenase n=1 Tax=Escherichia coli (strain UTI89 / UPEC) TaxID=364106 RepID=Q1RGI9_ECOUT|nr:putative glutamate dehydrogenase [Escherichia coli UTI89]EFU44433.1 hypothetical protein HMPREF9539_05053 [Escherichia coli MS 110-3]ESD34606.1 hypothetical protein HMPREF1604_04836 [Escherichia coli 908519]ESE17374.1 hypothetical protein HMPREF1617_02092 [Escherichia coli 908675]OSK81629.1 putative NAD-specific glutamate dehydrogenase encoded in antisense protein pair with dnaKJ [Escherichia coli H001]OSL15655.1 putative NAD-specific glutamate dehydrogenase encoded in antisense protein pai